MHKTGLLIALLSPVSWEIAAQEVQLSDTTANQLREFVITYQADRLTPVSFQNISPRALAEKTTGKEPSFLLSGTPSVTTYSDAGGYQGYCYFRMRGIDQTRINMTFDGVPLNESEDQGAYFSNYPDIFNSLSGIQIQRGVGTSKNGTASYGGSVMLFSANLHDSMRTAIGLSYGSYNSLRLFGEFNSGIKNNKAIYIRASGIHSDGYKYHSANSSQSIYVSGGFFFDKCTWKLNLLAGNQRNELAWLGVPDSLIAADRKTNLNTNEKDHFMQWLVQLRNSWRPDKVSSLQSSLYYVFLDGNYDFNLNGFLGLPTTDELFNYAFQSGMIGVFSNYSFTKTDFTWTTGVHANVYSRRHTGSEKTLGRLYENTGYKNELSFFTKADYRFGRFKLFADIQYRHAAFAYEGAVSLDKMQWDFINPKAGVALQLDPAEVIYYSIGNTGREPTRNDMFRGNDDLLADSSGNAVLSIKTPEYVADHELGFRHKRNKLDLDFNLYYMDFKNEIVLNGKFGPNGLALTDKVENSFRIGAELSVIYNFSKNFTLVNNSSFNYSRIKQMRQIFRPILTPPVIINQEVAYDRNGFEIALSGRYQDYSFINYANSATINSYFLLNGRIGYAVRRLQFDVFINNITDSEYFNNGYVDTDGSRKYFVQATRNLYASIKLNL